MIAVDIPGLRELRLEHLVMDYNGTLAEDGKLLPGVAATLKALAGTLQIHVVTADTFGCAVEQLAGLPVDLIVVPDVAQADRKLEFITSLNADKVVAVGNGRNDRKMLEAAALGIALIQREGGAVETLLCADVAATGILDALALLQFPKRLVATLRS
jgi:soluble P-type ATPase